MQWLKILSGTRRNCKKCDWPGWFLTNLLVQMSRSLMRFRIVPSFSCPHLGSCRQNISQISRQTSLSSCLFKTNLLLVHISSWLVQTGTDIDISNHQTEYLSFSLLRKTLLQMLGLLVSLNNTNPLSAKWPT